MALCGTAPQNDFWEPVGPTGFAGAISRARVRSRGRRTGERERNRMLADDSMALAKTPAQCTAALERSARRLPARSALQCTSEVECERQYSLEMIDCSAAMDSDRTSRTVASLSELHRVAQSACSKHSKQLWSGGCGPWWLWLVLQKIKTGVGHGVGIAYRPDPKPGLENQA